MKILAISDIHIDANSMPGGSFRDPHKVRELNIELCRDYIFPEIDKIIVEQSIDMLVTTGDLFDSSHPTLKAVSVVRNWVESLTIPSYHITGNHELIGLSRYDGNILDYVLEGIPLATVISKPGIHEGVAMIPWPDTKDWDKYINDIPKADIMFGHLEIDDVVDYASNGIKLDKIREKWPVSILGHYHKRTLSTSESVGYIGSVKPPRFTSGEIENPKPGIAIVNDGKVELVDLDVPRRCRKITDKDLSTEFISDLSRHDALILVGDSDKISEIRATGALLSTVLPKRDSSNESKPIEEVDIKSPMEYVEIAVSGDEYEEELIAFFSDFFNEVVDKE